MGKIAPCSHNKGQAAKDSEKSEIVFFPDSFPQSKGNALDSCKNPNNEKGSDCGKQVSINGTNSPTLPKNVRVLPQFAKQNRHHDLDIGGKVTKSSHSLKHEDEHDGSRQNGDCDDSNQNGTSTHLLKPRDATNSLADKSETTTGNNNKESKELNCQKERNGERDTLVKGEAITAGMDANEQLGFLDLMRHRLMRKNILLNYVVW
jgi:hypothetical protein